MKLAFEEAKKTGDDKKEESAATVILHSDFIMYIKFDVQDPNSKCKPFWFGEIGDNTFPTKMNDDVGEGVFTFKETKKVNGKDTSVYYNEETDIQIEQMKSKVKWSGNYWKIG